jgi:hypothetical protein
MFFDRTYKYIIFKSTPPPPRLPLTEPVIDTLSPTCPDFDIPSFRLESLCNRFETCADIAFETKKEHGEAGEGGYSTKADG